MPDLPVKIAAMFGGWTGVMLRTDTAENPNEFYQTKRGDGTTSRQILACPHGAIFVSPTKDYTTHLAHHLGRGDIKIEGTSFLLNDRWRGLQNLDVVVDHAIHSMLTREEKHKMNIALDYLGRRSLMTKPPVLKDGYLDYEEILHDQEKVRNTLKGNIQNCQESYISDHLLPCAVEALAAFDRLMERLDEKG